MRRRTERMWFGSAVACALAAGLVSCSTGANVGSRSVPRTAQVLRLVGDQDGIRLTVRLDRDVVAPGGRVRADVLVENRTTREVRYTSGPCNGGVGLSTSMSPVPGRRWPGRLGAFKDAAMATAHLPAPAFTPMPGVVQVCPAIAVLPGNGSLAPGAVLTRTLLWDADVAPGAPARPGAVVVNGSFDSLPRSVDVHGTIRIAGRDPHTPSPGEVVDAALAVSTFANTILASPPTAWQPSVAWFDDTWTVTACCAPRSAVAAIVRVDARTGAVLFVAP